MKKLAAGELENQVLQALWRSDEPMTPREVHNAMGDERGLAYTTVMTILVRLWQKGLLDRERLGRAFAYQPRETREARAASRMNEVLAASGDSQVALTHFVESLPVDQRDDLRKALRRSRGER